MYALLGISQDASMDEIKQAFRIKSFSNEGNFDVLKNAYEMLVNQKNKEIGSDKCDTIGNTVGNMIGNTSNNYITESMRCEESLHSMRKHPFFQPPNLSQLNLHMNPSVADFVGVDAGYEFETLLSSFLKRDNIDKIYSHMAKAFGEDEEKIHIEKDVNIKQFYESLYLTDIVDNKELMHIHLHEIKCDTENKFTISTNNKTKTYSIRLKVTSDGPFSIKDDCLQYTADISLFEALCGFSHTMYHLNGNSYTLKNSNVTDLKTTINLPGLGLKQSGGHGVLRICFNIKFPSNIDSNHHETLKGIIGNNTECS